MLLVDGPGPARPTQIPHFYRRGPAPPKLANPSLLLARLLASISQIKPRNPSRRNLRGQKTYHRNGRPLFPPVWGPPYLANPHIQPWVVAQINKLRLAIASGMRLRLSSWISVQCHSMGASHVRHGPTTFQLSWPKAVWHNPCEHFDASQATPSKGASAPFEHDGQARSAKPQWQLAG